MLLLHDKGHQLQINNIMVEKFQDANQTLLSVICLADLHIHSLILTQEHDFLRKTVLSTDNQNRFSVEVKFN